MDGPGAGQGAAADDPGAGQPSGGQAGARAREVTDVSELRRLWPEVLEAVKARRRFAWMVLDGKAQVASVDGSVLRLAFGREGDAKGFSQNGCDGVLREALAETLGVDWRIEAFAGSISATQATQATHATHATPANQATQATPTSTPPAAAGPADTGQAPRSDIPPPEEPEPDYPDVDGDERVEPDAAAGDGGLTGLPLLERELGARVIDEPPEPGAS